MTEKRAEYDSTEEMADDIMKLMLEELADDIMKLMLEELCTIGQAAEILGVDDGHARRLAEKGAIYAVKLDNAWVVHKPSLLEYERNKSKRGRPRGSKGKKNLAKTRAKNT